MTQAEAAVIEFGDLLKERTPTPEDLRRFALSQPNWMLRKLPDGRPALRVPDVMDRMAVTVAKLFSREPYRSAAIHVLNDPANGVPAELVVRNETIGNCSTCNAEVFEAVKECGCSEQNCPYIPRRRGQ